MTVAAYHGKGLLKTAIAIVQTYHQQMMMMFLCIHIKMNWTLAGMTLGYMQLVCLGVVCRMLHYFKG